MRGQLSSHEPAPSAPQFYSVAQVARLFGMSSMTVYRAIAAGEFPQSGSAGG
jgi:predicted DNA-binding transcriptional regulator AlpA